MFNLGLEGLNVDLGGRSVPQHVCVTAMLEAFLGDGFVQNFQLNFG